MPNSLVQPLCDGPLDVVGDVHGEVEALRSLLRHLGYAEDGTHPDNRRLVFVGDLTDRGPDSPAVVGIVNGLVQAQRAQCVLGNHELNILLGERKHDNHWFFGEEWSLDDSGEPTPAVLADDNVRQQVLDFFSSLPLVLERPDLRIVHACWDGRMVELARQEHDVLALYDRHRSIIESRNQVSNIDAIDRGLEHQNLNPVKVLTSGRERRVDPPFYSSGKWRHEERLPWWQEYQSDAICVFGHYSNYRQDVSQFGRAICIDFAVAKRWAERMQPSFDGNFHGYLAAVRFPELNVVFDNGDIQQIEKIF